MIEAGKEFHAAKPPTPVAADIANAGKRRILRACRWVVREPETEKMFSEFYDGDTMKAIELGDAFDLAYICVMLAAIGKAIPNIDRKRMPYI